jgi:hypothetical protein
MGGTAPGRDGTGRAAGVGNTGRRRAVGSGRRGATRPRPGREARVGRTDTAASRGPPAGACVPGGADPANATRGASERAQTDPGAARDAVPGRERRGDAGIVASA